MEMTFENYIQNPMGRKSGVFTQREMYRTLYREKLDKILVRENGRIQYQLFTGKGNTFYIYVKVPSEVVPNFYYDTVVKFFDGSVASSSLKDYNVQFYSNDPAFVFTYAYTMISKKLFIKDLIPKMSRKAVKDKPIEKNPDEVVGYVKSLYFAYLTMKKYDLFNKIKFKADSETYSAKSLMGQIMDADDKIEERQIKGSQIRHANDAKKRKERAVEISAKNNARIKSETNAFTKSVKSINKVAKKASKSNVVKGMKKTKILK